MAPGSAGGLLSETFLLPQAVSSLVGQYLPPAERSGSSSQPTQRCLPLRSVRIGLMHFLSGGKDNGFGFRIAREVHFLRQPALHLDVGGSQCRDVLLPCRKN